MRIIYKDKHYDISFAHFNFDRIWGKYEYRVITDKKYTYEDYVYSVLFVGIHVFVTQGFKELKNEVV